MLLNSVLLYNVLLNRVLLYNVLLNSVLLYNVLLNSVLLNSVLLSSSTTLKLLILCDLLGINIDSKQTFSKALSI